MKCQSQLHVLFFCAKIVEGHVVVNVLPSRVVNYQSHDAVLADTFCVTRQHAGNLW